jgi:hypothetical protein
VAEDAAIPVGNDDATLGTDEFVVEVALIEIAEELVAAHGVEGYGNIARAKAFDEISKAAAALCDDYVRETRRLHHATWRSIGSWFRISQQAASKRWGPR